MRKVITRLLALAIILVSANTIYTEAKESGLFKAEVISTMQDELMPKLAIIVDNKDTYEKLNQIKTNKKLNIYIYDGKNINSFKEAVLNDKPSAIYYLLNSTEASKKVEEIFKNITPIMNIEQVCIDTTIYGIAKEANYAESQKAIESFNTEATRKEYVKGFNDGTYFDRQKLIKSFEKLLNDERKSKGLKPLIFSAQLQKGTSVRAAEQAIIGNQRTHNKAHTRPNGKRSKTAFNEKCKYAGECTAELLGPRISQDVFNYTMSVFKSDEMIMQNEEDVAKALFVTWCNSLGHYKIMITNKFDFLINL